jgi:4-hydroxy-2-oxoglutarate aldolase
LHKLSEEGKRDSSVLAEAQRIQGIVAQADYTIASTSIAGTKALLEKLHGYGGVPRKPLPPTTPEEVEALLVHPHTQALVQLEAEIRGHV